MISSGSRVFAFLVVACAFRVQILEDAHLHPHYAKQKKCNHYRNSRKCGMEGCRWFANEPGSKCKTDCAGFHQEECEHRENSADCKWIPHDESNVPKCKNRLDLRCPKNWVKEKQDDKTNPWMNWLCESKDTSIMENAYCLQAEQESEATNDDAGPAKVACNQNKFCAWKPPLNKKHRKPYAAWGGTSPADNSGPVQPYCVMKSLICTDAKAQSHCVEDYCEWTNYGGTATEKPEACEDDNCVYDTGEGLLDGLFVAHWGACKPKKDA